jgi:RHS repeat-associated protein
LDSTKSVTADVTVTVIQKPVISFSASSTSVNVGNSTTLTWSCTNSPSTVSIDNGVGAVGASGSAAVTPGVNTTYTITASNLGGTATAQVAISVTQKPVIVSFGASPSSITKGRSSTLSWSTQGANSVTLNGQTMTGSSIVVAPSTTQTYTLIVSNGAGSNTSQVTVTVAESGTLTWKRDIIYLGTREAAEFDSAGMHVTMVDHLGSPRIVTGPSGQVESRQKYLPFGELLDQSGGYTPSKGYTNHEQTDPSGLIYMQARFYLPWMGRFASPDPARDQHSDDTQTWNIYSYVRNRPIMSTDPTGMEEKINEHAKKGADNDEKGLKDGDNEKKRKIAENEKTKSTNAPAPKPATGVIPPGGIAPSVTPVAPQPPKAREPEKPETPKSPEQGHVSVGVGATWVSPLLVGGGGKLTVDDKGHVWFTAIVAVGSPGVSGSVDVGTAPTAGSGGGFDLRGGGGRRPHHLGGGRVPTVGGSGDSGGAQLGVGFGTPGVQANYTYTWQVR